VLQHSFDLGGPAGVHQGRPEVDVGDSAVGYYSLLSDTVGVAVVLAQGVGVLASETYYLEFHYVGAYTSWYRNQALNPESLAS
jgi:hypothetical protein